MLNSSCQSACFESPLRFDRRGGFVGSNEVGVVSWMMSIWRQNRARLLAIFAPFVLVVLAYSNHFQNGFQFDDAHTVVNNAFIQDVRNIPHFFRDGTTFSSLPSNQSYRPLVSSLLAISYALAGGLKPFWFHGVIFALFLLEVLLLGYVLNQLLERLSPSPSNQWIAAVAACWYGLHPANADTVNYIIACSDIISTTGIVASFACYFAFPRGRRYFLYVLPAAIAVLAKPPAAVFAVLFGVYRLLIQETRTAGTTKAKRVFGYLTEVAPAFLTCGGALLLVQYMTPPHWAAGAGAGGRYLITQPYAALLYFQTFLWPSGLSADYDLAPFQTIGDPRFFTGFVFAMLITGGAIAASIWKRTRVIGFGLLWYIIGLLPTSLLPMAEVMNDHRTFLPYIGLIIAAAGGASLLIKERKPYSRPIAVMGTFAIILFLCGNAYATNQRNKVWKNNESLWQDVVAKSPGNSRGLMNYGNVLMKKGDYADALDYFRRAEVIAPRYSTLFINMAIAEGANGQLAQAERDFRKALSLAPESPDSHTYYAAWLLKHSRPAEALHLAAEAVALAPADIMARDLLLSAQTAVNRPATAEFYLGQSLEYYKAERYEESIRASRAALSLRANYAEAWNNIGAAYNQLGQYDLAAEMCEKALRLKPGYKLAANNLLFARQRLVAGQAK
jgi:tetratricopeptide (TPR) repeat protein